MDKVWVSFIFEDKYTTEFLGVFSTKEKAVEAIEKYLRDGEAVAFTAKDYGYDDYVEYIDIKFENNDHGIGTDRAEAVRVDIDKVNQISMT